MKHIILAVSINLLFFNCTIAQKKNIQIIGLHHSYLSNEPISFYVRNSDIHTKFYLLTGVQRKIKNKWVSVLRDIERTNFSKTDHLIILDTNAAKVTWTPINSAQFGKKTKINGEFRFIFSFGVIPNDLKNVEYGSIFYIE